MSDETPVVYDDLPPAGATPPVHSRGIDWLSVIETLKKHEGKAVLLPTMRDMDNVRSVYQTVKQVSHRDLRAAAREGWVLTANVRNSYIDSETGHRRGDLFLTLTKEK